MAEALRGAHGRLFKCGGVDDASLSVQVTLIEAIRLILDRVLTPRIILKIRYFYSWH